MELRELGEFGWIAGIREKFRGVPSGESLGIGDDCAVIPCGDGEALVVTTDMLIEDVHFLRAVIPPYLLGRKSLAVNLSDVASMAPFRSHRFYRSLVRGMSPPVGPTVLPTVTVACRKSSGFRCWAGIPPLRRIELRST